MGLSKEILNHSQITPSGEGFSHSQKIFIITYFIGNQLSHLQPISYPSMEVITEFLNTIEQFLNLREYDLIATALLRITFKFEMYRKRTKNYFWNATRDV